MAVEHEIDPQPDLALFDAASGTPGYLMRRCQQIAVSLFLQEFKAADLTPVQYCVLAALHQYKTLDQVTLGGVAALDRTTISVVVRRLEERGLLKRRRSDKDKRAKFIELTGEGRALVERCSGHVAQTQERILAPLSGDERTHFLTALRKIVAGNNRESRAPELARDRAPSNDR